MAIVHYDKELDASEIQGNFILVDYIDFCDKKPLSQCRSYGIGWMEDGNKPQCWKSPDKDLFFFPMGKYIKELVKEYSEELNKK